MILAVAAVLQLAATGPQRIDPPFVTGWNETWSTSTYMYGSTVGDFDDDGDGVGDTRDVFPLDASEWADTDGDGVGNNADLDDDGDGMPDSWERLHGLDPFEPSDALADADGDGVANDSDNCLVVPNAGQLDTDGDGIDDNEEGAAAERDTDGDGTPDYKDTDSDDDGVLDADEVSA